MAETNYLYNFNKSKEDQMAEANAGVWSDPSLFTPKTENEFMQGSTATPVSAVATPGKLEEPSYYTPTPGVLESGQTTMNLQPVSNILTKSASAPSNIITNPPDQFTQYWKQPVGTSKFNMPLDQFVRLAGMTAHAFAPDTGMGRLGADLSSMGAEAVKERARREYEAPNVLLQRRLAETQVKTAESKELGRQKLQEHIENLEKPVVIGGVTYPNQSAAWKAEGKNPDLEFLKSNMSVLAKYDPDRYTALQERLYQITSSEEFKKVVQDFRKEMATTQLDIKLKDFERKLEMDKLTTEFKKQGIDLATQRLALEKAKLEAGKGDKSTVIERMYKSYSDEMDKKIAAGKSNPEEKMKLYQFGKWYESEKAGGVAAARKEVKGETEVERILRERRERKEKGTGKVTGKVTSSSVQQPIPPGATRATFTSPTGEIKEGYILNGKKYAF